MKLLVILPLLACASAAPQYFWGPAVAAAPWFGASQYHAQDGLGAASYGYTAPNQASATFRDHFGNVIGKYSYIGADGKLNEVQYVADAGGFRVLANNLPQAPEANLAAPVFNPAPLQPVEDTADVKAAKAEFFRLYKEAEAAAAAAPERKKRQVFLAAAPTVAAVPTYAKTTVKTNYFEPSKDAKTPAATTLITLKEAEQDFITPVGYHYTYTAPTVAVKPAEVKAVPSVYPIPAFSYVF